MKRHNNKIEKKHNLFLKNGKVNRYIFFKKFHGAKISSDIKSLLASYSPEISIKNVWISALYGDIDDKYPVSITDGYDFFIESYKLFAKKDKESQKKIYNSIHQILDKHELGYEWVDTFIGIIMKGQFVPPAENLYITYANRPKRIVLYINPSTSLEDIELAFDEIKRKQKELWPAYKKTNYKKDSLEELETILLHGAFKKRMTDEYNLKRLTSEWEERIYKRNKGKSIKIIKNEINEYRRKQNNKRPVKLKGSISDRKYLRRSFSDKKNLAKEVAKLRVQRHRALK